MIGGPINRQWMWFSQFYFRESQFYSERISWFSRGRRIAKKHGTAICEVRICFLILFSLLCWIFYPRYTFSTSIFGRRNSVYVFSAKSKRRESPLFSLSDGFSSYIDIYIYFPFQFPVRGIRTSVNTLPPSPPKSKSHTPPRPRKTKNINTFWGNKTRPLYWGVCRRVFYYLQQEAGNDRKKAGRKEVGDKNAQ